MARADIWGRKVQGEQEVQIEAEAEDMCEKSQGKMQAGECEHLQRESDSYLRLFYQENGQYKDYATRAAEVRAEIERSGTYQQSYSELAYGARVAWRNSARCIGRLHWRTLAVRDMRHLDRAEDIYAALVEHLRVATNGGKIRSTMSVFAPVRPGQAGIRVWNPQLLRYAGYRQQDGSVIGDPQQIELTEVIRRLGWQGGQGGAFDLLPIVIQLPGQPPRFFELPREVVLEVPLSHPELSWFADMGLKWHALPVISHMRLEIGGISYSAAPFNGWYMGAEIGARNLGDSGRYNLLPSIAERMGLDVRSDRTLWKDRALVELNVAVLHSFARYGVSIVDHHTASRQFMCHDLLEAQAGRVVPAHWVWLVPPLSGSTSPIFHISTYKNTLLTPRFFHQPAPWRAHDQEAGCPVRRGEETCLRERERQV